MRMTLGRFRSAKKFFGATVRIYSQGDSNVTSGAAAALPERHCDDKRRKPRHRGRVYHYVVAVWRTKMAELDAVKHWTIISEKLSVSGFSWGCSSEIDATGRVLYTPDAYRNGKRFTVIADPRLTAFLELERVTQQKLR